MKTGADTPAHVKFIVILPYLIAPGQGVPLGEPKATLGALTPMYNMGVKEVWIGGPK